MSTRLISPDFLDLCCVAPLLPQGFSMQSPRSFESLSQHAMSETVGQPYFIHSASCLLAIPFMSSVPTNRYLFSATNWAKIFLVDSEDACV